MSSNEEEQMGWNDMGILEYILYAYVLVQHSRH